LDAFLFWLEQTQLSAWLRGETGAVLAFPVVICLHAVGMGLLVGIACIINLRVIGWFSFIDLQRLKAFLPFAWFGLVVNAVSGVLLLITYPTKALTNPVFYVKMTCIVLALYALCWMRSRQFLDGADPSGRVRLLAAMGSLLWLVGIVTGRLLAYTYSRLMSA